MSFLVGPQRLIAIGQKRSSELVVANDLHAYINNKHASSSPDVLAACVPVIAQFQAMRNEALFRSTGGHDQLAKLSTYHDQLTSMESVLPISKSEVNLTFKWQDAFDKGSLLFAPATWSLTSGMLERASVMFNIGALCSQLAAQQLAAVSASELTNNDEEALKSAVRLLNQAAGAFAHIRDQMTPLVSRADCTFDMYPETLSVLAALMLAQAQEVVCLKAVAAAQLSVGSRLAASCSLLFADAVHLHQQDRIRDAPQLANMLPVLVAKRVAYLGLADFYKAQHEMNERNIGEALSRTIHAMEIFHDGERLRAPANEMASFRAHLAGARELRARAEHENALIYHARVPDYAQLRAIEPACLVKATRVAPPPPTFVPLFDILTTQSASRSFDEFATRKGKAFDALEQSMRDASARLLAAMHAWHLPGELETHAAMESSDRALVAKCESIRAESGGVERIDRMIGELSELVDTNRALVRDIRHEMQGKEDKVDEEALNSYEDQLASVDKLAQILEEGRSKLLNSRSMRMLSEQTTTRATFAEAVHATHSYRELARLVAKCEALQNVRKVLAFEMSNSSATSDEAVRAKFAAAFVTASSSSSNSDRRDMIERELDAVVAPLRAQVYANVNEQEETLTFVERALSEYGAERSAVEADVTRMLRMAVAKYEEIVENVGQRLSACEQLRRKLSDMRKLLFRTS